MDTENLVRIKLAVITNDNALRKITTEYFTEHYKPLIACVIRLRRVVFPGGVSWKTEDPGLYSRMKTVLHDAQTESKSSIDSRRVALPSERVE